MTSEKSPGGSPARARLYLAVVCVLGAIALWFYISNLGEERIAARSAAEDASFERALVVGCYAASADRDAPVRTITINSDRAEDNLGNSFSWEYTRGKPDTVPHAILLTSTSSAWSYLPTDRVLMFTESDGQPTQNLDHNIAAISVDGRIFKRSAKRACAAS